MSETARQGSSALTDPARPDDRLAFRDANAARGGVPETRSGLWRARAGSAVPTVSIGVEGFDAAATGAAAMSNRLG